MTITHDSEEITQDILRTALGLKPRYRYIWNGQELRGPCEMCGHHPVIEEPALRPAGDPVVDVVQDATEPPRRVRRAIGLSALTRAGR
ncbi:hypothetical protein, partial [Pseudonocardia tropica]|uniref:hypothetical protein n=1 Tax=Pseudonocardia tropica TaxID=681289 RepID=UPI0031EC0EDA